MITSKNFVMLQLDDTKGKWTMMRKFLGAFMLVFVLVLAGCSDDEEIVVDVEPITTVQEYNALTEEALLDKLGEPETKEVGDWTVASTGEHIEMTQWTYTIDTIPARFFIVDNEVVRMNLYIDEWDEELHANNAHELLGYVAIEPDGKEFRVRVDNEKNMQVAWPLPEIDEVYASHERGDVKEIRITYDMTVF